MHAPLRGAQTGPTYLPVRLGTERPAALPEVRLVPVPERDGGGRAIGPLEDHRGLTPQADPSLQGRFWSFP